MNQKKTIIILIFILLVGIIGLTVAYFSNTTSINNLFSTKEYGSTIEEVFESPDNWLPGTTTDKEITVTNSGSVDEAVRISYSETWKAKDNTILSGLIDQDGNLTSTEENSEHAAIINFSDNDDWTYSNGYYYYNYKLSPNDTTSSLIDSVTFNSKTKNSSNCITNTNNGTKTITCNSTQSGYDGATYTLTFTIETVQYDKYKQAWGVDIATFGMKPMTAQQFISKANPVSVTNYTDGDIHEMYTFEHSATEQTPALTDYRYIGDDPYNFVYFNCDSLDNQNEDTCEVWRIIGVFDVEGKNGNFETRYKLVRGSAFAETMAWDNRPCDGEECEGSSYPSGKNDWYGSLINSFLNNDYYYRMGSASLYGLKNTSRNMAADTKYYLGSFNTEVDNVYQNITFYGNIEDIYKWERGLEKVNDSRNLYWIGKIGLLYPSDAYMPYANGVDDNCYNNTSTCLSIIWEWNAELNKMESYKNPNAFPEKNWIYNTNNLENMNDIETMWFISPYKILSYEIFGFSAVGKLFSGSGKQNYGIRPTLYLKSNVKIMDGNGSIDNPYKLGFEISSNIYEEYEKEQVVTYNDEDYYVLEDSDVTSDYVTVIKKDVLTANQINTYSTNYTSASGEYPFYRSDSCNSSTQTSCITNYNNSDIKKIVDGWANSFSNDLKEVDGYKARLISEDEIYDNMVASQTPSSVYYHLANYLSSDNYWTMYIADNNNSVNVIADDELVYNEVYSNNKWGMNLGVRPVINLKKCAIDGTC